MLARLLFVGVARVCVGRSWLKVMPGAGGAKHVDCVGFGTMTFEVESMIGGFIAA